MAKKKKNEEIIRIVDRELYPTVIGVVDDTEKKPIFLIVIFIILIGLLFGLPYITDFYTNLKGDTLGGSSSNTTKNNTNDNTKDNVDVGVDNSDAPFYLVATSNSVKYDDIEIINLSFTSLTSKDYISLTIKNTTDKAFEINDKNYYLELYDSNKTLIQRIKITGATLNANGTVNLVFEIINKNNVNQFRFLSKTLDEYPEFSAGDSGNGAITCKKNNETYIYKFKNNRLYTETELYTVNTTNTVVNASTYDNKVSTYNAINGITAQTTNENNTFEFKAEIDLSKAKVSSLNNIHLYENETLAKTINFEMSAMGYSCS
ncbi:MAG: hypothetical protein IJ574_05350 [Bacilli bacterium]|nr:hypothetical protein [Bacilli bacterium]